MADDWGIVSLEEIAASDGRRAFAMGPFGSNIKSENYQPNGVPVIRGVNLLLTGFSADDLVFLSEEKAADLQSSQAFPDDLVFVAQGTVGRVGVIPRKARFAKVVLSQNLMKFTCDRAKADPRFVYYFFTSREGQHEIRSHVNPTGVPCISRPLSSLKGFQIPLPPLAEQRAIANILGGLDDKIELNRRMNETLEGLARAIFQSWFVDFDPVRAQRDGLPPPALSPSTAALFPDSFEDVDSVSLPSGWTIKRLGDVADLSWGDTNVTKSAYAETGYTAFSAAGPDGFLSYFDFDRTGVVVSAIGANAGVTWLARGKWSCIKNTIRLWATDPSLSTAYLYFLTRGDNIWPLRGSAQLFISQTDARNLRILCPANGIAQVFGELVEPLFAQIDKNQRESSALAAIRDALLPKLLSGEIRVAEAERLVEDAG